MKLKYNAPTVLTFTFLSVAVFVLMRIFSDSGILYWFSVPGKGGFFPSQIRSWITLFTHALGHKTWDHLLSNFTMILLVGPILEENYGSLSLLIMILITAVITGALNIFFFSTGLMGASGVLFMMVLLASFTNFNQGEIPLTFILIMALYLGRELFNSFAENNISEFAHIVGGFCGSLFGFFRPNKGNL